MTWHKSSKCESNGCGRVKVENGTVHVSTTRRPDLVAVFDLDEWAEWLDAVKRGDFDHLLEQP